MPLNIRILGACAAALLAVAACSRRQPAPPVVPVSEPEPAPAAPAPTTDPDAERRAAAEREAREREARLAAMRRTLEERIYFDFDRSDLSAEARTALDAKYDILQSNPDLRIRVSGHTDERGSDEYNLALGQRRAAAAKRYLTQRGLDPSRVEVSSFGEERPTCTEATESCWSRNRRDEFEVTAGAIVSGGR